jgi:hypothetical protein
MMDAASDRKGPPLFYGPVWNLVCAILGFTMSGKSQHYLPQFLQKGFLSKVDGKERYTWLYRRGEAAREELTRRIGESTFFYGDPASEVSADPEITKLENSYSRLLDSLRKVAPGIALQDSRVPLLVGHLAIRTRCIREVASNAGTNIIAALGSQFPDQEVILRMLLLPDNMERILKGVTGWEGFPETVREILRGVYKARIVEDFPAHYANSMIVLREQSRSASLKLSKDLRAKLNRRLADNPAPEAIATRYQNYRWTVLEAGEELILGDCACLVAREDGSYRGFDDTDGAASRILLPISSYRVLCGSPGFLTTCPDHKKLNDAAACSSYEFFISRSHRPEFDSIQKRIGQTAELLSHHEAEDLACESFLQAMADYFKESSPI